MTVHQLPLHTPQTDGKLFDVLHDMFGVGTYIEDGPIPWWKFRQVECGKVKNCRSKNDRSLADLYVAALYCRAFGIDVRGVTYLIRHVPKGWTWWDGRTNHLLESTNDVYADAIRQEANNPDPSWLNRLVRTSPSTREEVLREWRSRSR